MKFPTEFIRATEDYTTFEHHVPAPYFRKAFFAKQEVTARLIIGVCGFYELYLNGKRCTKGPLAPYISNPDHIVYYDCYELQLNAGKNILGILLGNGLKNNPGGYIWDFDKAGFRGAPCFALELTYTCDGETQSIVSDESFLTAPSPIIFDDYRFGEYYDARREMPNWSEPDFDDSQWSSAIKAPVPKGDKRICEAEPIIVSREIKPIEIVREGDGYRYDFGQNCAGVCKLTINGTEGQKVELLHGEVLRDGVLDISNIWFTYAQWERDREIVHRDIYICSGKGTETYTPKFTYHGFRYVLVTGITEEQATPELLTYMVMHSALEERGGFSCSDETANTLQRLTRCSDLSNFYYFPTDCPQREKNGWTADAALSCEHMLLNLNPENSYREWMHNIVKTQDERGALPGIVPTDNWGYGWGNGPGWDSVLVYLPYFVYIYRGDLSIAEEAMPAIFKYLCYLDSQTDEKGLIHIGLGDWCQPGRVSEKYVAPLEFTDTVIAMDIAVKSAILFEKLNMESERDFAQKLSLSLKNAVRKWLIDPDTMMAAGNCQTTQAMGLFYGIFEESERQTAFDRLLELIEIADGHIDTGVLGGRVIFHVLTEFGYSELAFKMIVRPDFPSYGNWVARGATSLWEEFQPEGGNVASQNHHFWGDISSWFIQALAGIRINPNRDNANEAVISPSFIPHLNYASAFHYTPSGKINVLWERNAGGICLNLEFPISMTGKIKLEQGWCFENGQTECEALSGTYNIQKSNSVCK